MKKTKSNSKSILLERFLPESNLITFEVVRHRLWQINDEQGRSIINVSGSPVASETNDFNVAIANADGKLICIGPYVLFHLTAVSLMISQAKELLGDRFIEEGDVYLCNVAGTTNFGAGPISFIVGDSAIYSGSIWQRSGGATGSVT